MVGGFSTTNKNCSTVSKMTRGGSRGKTSSPKVIASYRLGKTLGFGAFGKVKLARHAPTGLKVAIKILDRQSIDNSAAEQVRREINIMRLFSHPHIIRLYEVIETQLNIYIVMEYMNCGELFDYIVLSENGRIEEDQARHFFQQIISGVECCHNNKVVHRDLKPENLLLDSKRNVKITDFGLSNFMLDGHFLKTNCGSPNYAAPEVVSGRLYAGPEVDIWSCGVILYALLTGRLPFDDENLSGLYTKIKGGIYASPSHLSGGAQDLINRMLVVDPINRISIPEICRHPWFQQYLPRYIAMHTVDSMYGVVKAAVTYYLVLDSQCRAHSNFLKNKQTESSEGMDRPLIYVRPLAPFQKNWLLGFESQASANDTMTGVLKLLQRLNVRWKKIGDYNMKCLWLPPCYTFTKDPTTSIHVYGPIINRVSSWSPNAIKFEFQLYKASNEFYLVDLQRIHGPPFLFLEICAAFYALFSA